MQHCEARRGCPGAEEPLSPVYCRHLSPESWKRSQPGTECSVCPEPAQSMLALLSARVVTSRLQLINVSESIGDLVEVLSDSEELGWLLQW